ncbi:MAG: hypothetical protein AB9882_03805 [Ignavibacteriaceae bacterium]
MHENQWDDVIGFDSVKDTLKTFIQNNKIPQALILLGKEGIGKDFLAAKFIQILNETRLAEDQLFGSSFLKYIFALPRGQNEGSDDDPYEKLKAAELDQIKSEILSKSENPYYVLSIPRANDIKINSIRDIGKYLSLRYNDYDYRLILISHANRMNDAAQNALLKSLEEPPPGVIFVLTTDDLSGLFSTIVSRCWIIKCHPLTKEEISNALIRFYDYDPNDALMTAEFGDGSVSAAANFVDLNITQLKDEVVNFLKHILGNKIHSAFKLATEFTREQGTEEILLFLNLLKGWFLDILRYGTGKKDNLFFGEFIENIHNFHNKFYDTGNLNGIISKLDSYSSLIKERNINTNIIWFNIITEINSFRN